MIDLPPLETLYDAAGGVPLLLPAELARLYGGLWFPPHPDRPRVIGNFVTTLDGVVSLAVPGHAGGGAISGFNPHDRMVMGVLRAVADAVIVGAGTLRVSPRHVWLAEETYRPLADSYRAFRAALGKTQPPLNVFVTRRGDIDLDLPVFQSGRVPALIVTTAEGAAGLRTRHPSSTIQIESVKDADSVSVGALLEIVQRVRACDIILTEGGPHLMGDFLAGKRLDELFLTLAPQIAGREDTTRRAGLVTGKVFAPDHALWGALAGVKRGASHLFLRYFIDPEGR